MACPEAPMSRTSGFFSSPVWLRQVSHSCTLPAVRIERKNGFSESQNSCSDVCHLDLKHGSYFPNSCYNKIVAKWFVWAISPYIVAAPEQQNASFPTQTAAPEPSCSCKCLSALRVQLNQLWPLVQAAAWVQGVAKKASKKAGQGKGSWELQVDCFFPILDSGFAKSNVPLWPIIILLFTCGEKNENLSWPSWSGQGHSKSLCWI